VTQTLSRSDAHPAEEYDCARTVLTDIGEFEDGRGLRDRHIVEHAKRTDDAPGEHQSGDRGAAKVGGD
jgi:hypothetical protein